MSLHDVAPPFVEAIREQLVMLDGIGVEKVVLHVVPRWHDCYPLQDCTELVNLLQSRVERGAEVSLHGFTHQARGRLRGAALTRLRGRLFAAGNAEFLTLTKFQARDALTAGAAVIEEAGLQRPKTFCAPGWLIAPEGEVACRDAGFDTLAGMFSARDLRSGRLRRIPSFGHMGTPYEVGVGSLNAIVLNLLVPRASVVAVYFHPQRFSMHSAQPVLNQLARMVNDGWRSVTYADLVHV